MSYLLGGKEVSKDPVAPLKAPTGLPSALTIVGRRKTAPPATKGPGNNLFDRITDDGIVDVVKPVVQSKAPWIIGGGLLLLGAGVAFARSR